MRQFRLEGIKYELLVVKPEGTVFSYNLLLISLVANILSLCCFYSTLLFHCVRWVANSQDIALTWYFLF